MGKSSKKKDAGDNLIDNCWLEYNFLEDARVISEYKKWCQNIVSTNYSAIQNNALCELVSGIEGMLGIKPYILEKPVQSTYILLGTFEDKNVMSMVSMDELDQINEDGFIIKFARKEKDSTLLIAGKKEVGLLYGVYSFLRDMQTQIEPEKISKIENPQNKLRMINHWDNIDGSIERGYAGKSIFFKNNKIIKNLSRIENYARLLSSTGINSITINNVNVHKYETKLITNKYLPDVAKLANIFRKYGIKLFLSVNFASPMELGNLSTADPFDKDVQKWWKSKIKEIYEYIPDFGGFLVKADSEFRPGPFTYGRNHADGANMLAEGLKKHGGIVIWRCFVYNCMQNWRDLSIDRARAAYDHFMPLDGQFHENVLLQIKNGPMDFQVREPVSPLIGGLEKTNITLEFQITQEYTGQQKHLCYLVPMWKEVLTFDTYSKGKGSEIKDIVSGSLFNNKLGGIAAVVNVGDDSNWTGHKLAQANLYGYGRLTWNPNLTAEEIADEWIRMTFSNEEDVVKTISQLLLRSREIYESYTSPLGIGWMVNPNHHYGPNVDGYEYANWGTYHRADLKAIGVDRTVKNGTGYVGQYHKEVAEMYEVVETCPEELLLFFHRIPYVYKLKSGKTLIQHIYDTHFDGVEQANDLKDKWQSLEGKIADAEFKQVLQRLEGQIVHAKEWRDVINSYFYRKTGIEDELGRKIY